MLFEAGHPVVARAQVGESDTSWFNRAFEAGAECIISGDKEVLKWAEAAGLVALNPSSILKGKVESDAQLVATVSGLEVLSEVA
jgi:predicted nucleic acid-binding protein